MNHNHVNEIENARRFLSRWFARINNSGRVWMGHASGGQTWNMKRPLQKLDYYSTNKFIYWPNTTKSFKFKMRILASVHRWTLNLLKFKAHCIIRLNEHWNLRALLRLINNFPPIISSTRELRPVGYALGSHRASLFQYALGFCKNVCKALLHACERKIFEDNFRELIPLDFTHNFAICTTLLWLN